jgi:hypothetical protein
VTSGRDNDRNRIERKFLRTQNKALGWALIAMVILAVGALCAQMIFGHH